MGPTTQGHCQVLRTSGIPGAPQLPARCSSCLAGGRQCERSLELRIVTVVQSRLFLAPLTHRVHDLCARARCSIYVLRPSDSLVGECKRRYLVQVSQSMNATAVALALLACASVLHLASAAGAPKGTTIHYNAELSALLVRCHIALLSRWAPHSQQCACSLLYRQAACCAQPICACTMPVMPWCMVWVRDVTRSHARCCRRSKLARFPTSMCADQVSRREEQQRGPGINLDASASHQGAPTQHPPIHSTCIADCFGQGTASVQVTCRRGHGLSFTRQPDSNLT